MTKLGLVPGVHGEEKEEKDGQEQVKIDPKVFSVLQPTVIPMPPRPAKEPRKKSFLCTILKTSVLTLVVLLSLVLGFTLLSAAIYGIDNTFFTNTNEKQALVANFTSPMMNDQKIKEENQNQFQEMQMLMGAIPIARVMVIEGGSQDDVPAARPVVDGSVEKPVQEMVQENRNWNQFPERPQQAPRNPVLPPMLQQPILEEEEEFNPLREMIARRMQFIQMMRMRRIQQRLIEKAMKEAMWRNSMMQHQQREVALAHAVMARAQYEKEMARRQWIHAHRIRMQWEQARMAQAQQMQARMAQAHREEQQATEARHFQQQFQQPQPHWFHPRPEPFFPQRPQQFHPWGPRPMWNRPQQTMHNQPMPHPMWQREPEQVQPELQNKMNNINTNNNNNNNNNNNMVPARPHDASPQQILNNIASHPQPAIHDRIYQQMQQKSQGIQFNQPARPIWTAITPTPETTVDPDVLFQENLKKALEQEAAASAMNQQDQQNNTEITGEDVENIFEAVLGLDDDESPESKDTENQQPEQTQEESNVFKAFETEQDKLQPTELPAATTENVFKAFEEDKDKVRDELPDVEEPLVKAVTNPVIIEDSFPRLEERTTTPEAPSMASSESAEPVGEAHDEVEDPLAQFLQYFEREAQKIAAQRAAQPPTIEGQAAQEQEANFGALVDVPEPNFEPEPESQ